MATLIGAASWTIPRSALPAAVSVRPSLDEHNRARELASLGVATQGGLQVSVSTDRGAGAAYRDGEQLSVMLTVNKNAYVRLYHIDSAGLVQLIWPNLWDGGDGLLRAGQTARLPPTGEPFTFDLHAPYGLEFLKAIACTVPFSDNQSSFSPLGSDYKSSTTRGLSVSSSGGRQAEVAEALASYCIGP